MRWRKLGLVFDVSKAGTPWMHSHAQVPVADPIRGDLFRVYFATRTREQIPRIGSVVVELGDTVRTLEVGTAPVLEPGPLGTFDEHGVYPSCIVDEPGLKRMYYVGFCRGSRAPMFYASIGLAESLDGGETWRKCSIAPLLDRSEHDPCLVSSPHVVRQGGRYRMTYVSGTRWSEVDGRLQSHYHIKYAESDDGVRWRRDGRVAIDFAGDDETNIARSWVTEEADRLHMLFGYVKRGSSYRLGYAESDDWVSWRRDDSVVGLDVSPSGFDSEMVCYPNVVRHLGRTYLFYNGNRFGQEGFGAAVKQ